MHVMVLFNVPSLTELDADMNVLRKGLKDIEAVSVTLTLKMWAKCDYSCVSCTCRLLWLNKALYFCIA